jgi:hypothetical protein
VSICNVSYLDCTLLWGDGVDLGKEVFVSDRHSFALIFSWTASGAEFIIALHGFIMTALILNENQIIHSKTSL